MPAHSRCNAGIRAVPADQSIADTLGLLDRHGAGAWVMAGGMDTFDWLKDRIRRPTVVVDLGSVAELRGIKEANGGLEIGAN